MSERAKSAAQDFPRTQIVCTIGPACRTQRKIEALIKAGMDSARLHCSYANQAEMAVDIARIRKAEAATGRKINILQDLTGAKVRLLNLGKNKVELKKGAVFTLTARQIKGNASIAAVSIPEVLSVIEPGDTVLLADGDLQLTAMKASPKEVRCKVRVGGKIKTEQAVHVPGKAAPVKVPTEKDFDDVCFGLKHKVDWVAESYATSAAEVIRLREFIRGVGGTAKIIVKIERCEALDHLEEIIGAADMVMVARGDLGLEVPLEEIAIVQKKIIQCARRLGKPVITATEMLLSMMERDRPTRAEVSDVTNAILDGTDAVMLSGESSMGKFPVEATRMMARIAAFTDKCKVHPIFHANCTSGKRRK